jgi:hypothetical protein
MRWYWFLIAVFIWVPAMAADLGPPKLSESLAKQNFFDPDRFLVPLDLSYGRSGYSLQPELGLGYAVREFDAGTGFDESVYKVHAQAGGKLDLQRVYLSGGAKLPVYTYGITAVRNGLFSSQTPLSRHEYDFAHLSSSTLLWTGEIGLRVGFGADITFYYDQNAFDAYQAGRSAPEERFGTRLIFRFK